jgi:hypothetical protein
MSERRHFPGYAEPSPCLDCGAPENVPCKALTDQSYIEEFAGDRGSCRGCGTCLYCQLREAAKRIVQKAKDDRQRREGN